MNLAPTLTEQTIFRGLSFMPRGCVDFLAENRDKQWVHFRWMGSKEERGTWVRLIKNMETGNSKWIAATTVEQLRTRRYEGQNVMRPEYTYGERYEKRGFN